MQYLIDLSVHMKMGINIECLMSHNNTFTTLSMSKNVVKVFVHCCDVIRSYTSL